MDDMNSINRKLRSQRGASITFALLIFLVCSVVSIAVVVAGSAAAGRMSQRAETDQRYYAVSSAVELLCNEFKDIKATAEYETDMGRDPFDLEQKVQKNDIDVTKIEDKAGDVPLHTGTSEAVSKSLVYKLANPWAIDESDDTFTLTVPEESAYTFLNCTIEERVMTDGRVIFKVYNTNGDKRYALEATFDANISTSTSQYKTTEGVQKEKVTYTLVWSLNSIKKSVAPVPMPTPEP